MIIPIKAFHLQYFLLNIKTKYNKNIEICSQGIYYEHWILNSKLKSIIFGRKADTEVINMEVINITHIEGVT